MLYYLTTSSTIQKKSNSQKYLFLDSLLHKVKTLSSHGSFAVKFFRKVICTHSLYCFNSRSLFLLLQVDFCCQNSTEIFLTKVITDLLYAKEELWEIFNSTQPVPLEISWTLFCYTSLVFLLSSGLYFQGTFSDPPLPLHLLYH